MRLQVIDRDERDVPRRGDCLGGHDADDDAADQAGAAGHRDPVEILERDAGLVAGPGDDRIKVLEMRARGDLRDDPAERPVVVELAEHDVRQDRPVAVHDRGGRLVAAGFDSENAHEDHIAHLSRGVARSGYAFAGQAAMSRP